MLSSNRMLYLTVLLLYAPLVACANRCSDNAFLRYARAPGYEFMEPRGGGTEKFGIMWCRPSKQTAQVCALFRTFRNTTSSYSLLKLILW
jgi:hypothetical protein